MKNSLRISTFIIALVLIIAGVTASHASGTRMKSLGMGADTYWMIQKDTAYATVNPAYYVQFPALITFNETSAAVSTGGIWLKPMDDLMIVINANGYPLGIGDAGTATYGNFQQLPTALNSTNMAVRENYNVNASYKMGPMSVGLRYGTADRMDKNTTAGTTNEKAVDTYQVGFFMDLGGGMDFDVAFKMTNYAFDQKGTAPTAAGTVYKASTSDTDVTARFNMALSQTNSVHVWLKYNLIDRADKLGTNKVKYNIDRTLIGLTDEMKFAGNSMVYFGFLYEMRGQETKITGSKTAVDATYLNFVMGAEANLTKNMTMRLGANRTWDQNVTTKVTGATKVEQLTDSGNAAGTLGLQYKMGHWTLEAQLARAFLTNGLYLVTGNATAGWAAEVNVAYIFGNPGVFDDEKKM